MGEDYFTVSRRELEFCNIKDQVYEFLMKERFHVWSLNPLHFICHIEFSKLNKKFILNLII